MNCDKLYLSYSMLSRVFLAGHVYMCTSNILIDSVFIYKTYILMFNTFIWISVVDLRKFRTYKGQNVRDLLRAMRNKVWGYQWN